MVMNGDVWIEEKLDGIELIMPLSVRSNFLCERVKY